jgi:hypothetical protein
MRSASRRLLWAALPAAAWLGLWGSGSAHAQETTTSTSEATTTTEAPTTTTTAPPSPDTVQLDGVTFDDFGMVFSVVALACGVFVGAELAGSRP